jgi:hypothetical protein
MYYGGGNSTKVNLDSTPLPFPFVSLYLRGGTDGFALKGGDATAGKFKTMYDGPRPDCAIAGTCHRHGNHTYQPMSKRGAIILGTGGDNSNGAMGIFFEGIVSLRCCLPLSTRLGARGAQGWTNRSPPPRSPTADGDGRHDGRDR